MAKTESSAHPKNLPFATRLPKKPGNPTVASTMVPVTLILADTDGPNVIEVSLTVSLVGPAYHVINGSLRSLSGTICTDTGNQWIVLGLIDSGVNLVGRQVPLGPAPIAQLAIGEPNCYTSMGILANTIVAHNTWEGAYTFTEVDQVCCTITMTSDVLTIPGNL